MSGLAGCLYRRAEFSGALPRALQLALGALACPLQPAQFGRSPREPVLLRLPEPVVMSISGQGF